MLRLPRRHAFLAPLLLLPSCHAFLGAVFEVADDAHGLAFDVRNITLDAPANLTFTWRRADRAAGGAVATTARFGAGADAPDLRLMRFSPGQRYEIAVSDADTGRALQRSNVTAGLIGVAELDAGGAMFAEVVSGAPSFELLVFDRGGPLIGVDREGWVVWYSNNSGSVFDQLDSYGIVTLGAGGSTLSATGFMELSAADAVLAASPATSLFANLSHESRATDGAGALVLSLQARRALGFTRLSREWYRAFKLCSRRRI